jgi:hypothetical protein
LGEDAPHGRGPVFRGLSTIVTAALLKLLIAG